MKTKLLLVVALLFSIFTTSETLAQDNNKLIRGKWYPSRSESGEKKGFNFKKGGKCKAINIPSLDLKNWEIKDGVLITTGFEIAEDGTRSEYRDEEKIEKLTKNEFVVVAREACPKLVFRYVRISELKKLKPVKVALR